MRWSNFQAIGSNPNFSSEKLNHNSRMSLVNSFSNRRKLGLFFEPLANINTFSICLSSPIHPSSPFSHLTELSQAGHVRNLLYQDLDREVFQWKAAVVVTASGAYTVGHGRGLREAKHKAAASALVEVLKALDPLQGSPNAPCP